MLAISLRLPDELLRSCRRRAQALQMSRAAYIRGAIERMNADTARLESERLTAVSHRVREESMKVNAEFADVETAPGT